MSQNVDRFIKQHKEYFSRNKSFIESNFWNDTLKYKENIDGLIYELSNISKKLSEQVQIKKKKDISEKIREVGEKNQKSKAATFKQETDITNSIVNRLSAFIKETENSGDRSLEKVQSFINFTVNIIDLHIKKCDTYLNYSMDELEKKIETEEEVEYRGQEIKFQDEVFQKKIKIQDVLDDLNLKSNFGSKEIKFFKDEKAPLIMREPLCLLNEEVDLRTENIPVFWNVSTSKEMFINMKNSDIPKWNVNKHYFDQETSTLQFWSEEQHKIKNGINLGGFFMHGWLYFHLNFFMTPIPQIDGTEPNIQPDLRDNEYFFAENLKEIINPEYPEFYSKALLIYGTRRFGKSVILASLAHWRSITKFNSSGTIIGGTSSDLNALTSKIKTSMSFIEKPLRLGILSQNWDNGETFFGIKEDSSTSRVFSSLIVQNLEAGTLKKTQKTAGLAPSVSIYDEIGKYPFLKPYLAALPSFKTPYGFKTITVLAGCVCAGTKVWNNEGQLVNIEDLTQEQGILGYDGNSAYKENIEWFKAPEKKPCYRIETTGRNFIECSDDHPLLWSNANNRTTNNKKKVSFKLAKDLKVGDQLMVLNEIPIFGSNKIKDARLLGLLIGDGNYSLKATPSLSCGDEEIFIFIKEKYNYKINKQFKMKTGGTFRNLTLPEVRFVIKEAGIFGQTKLQKRLPKNIHKYDEKSVTEILGGYFDADGNVYYNIKKNSIRVVLTSICEELLVEVKYQLLKLGIGSSITKEKRNIKPSKEYEGQMEYIFRLYINRREDVIRFKNKINFLVTHKQKTLEMVDTLFKGNCNIKLNPCKFELDPINKKGQYFVGKENLQNLRSERITKIEFIGQKDIYNMHTRTTNTYLSNGFVTKQTGGEAELSKDAMDVLSNPKAFDLLPMNWDKLESRMDPEQITWKRRMFATFFPGQMAYEEGFIKDPTPLDKYLKIENEELAKITINVTRWKENKEYLEKKAAEAKNSKTAKASLLVQQRKVQYPLDPEDCFLSSEENPFPVQEAQERKQYLYDTGKWDRRRKLIRNSNGNIEVQISTSELASFPHPGGIIDAPILIFEDIPENTPSIYTYVAGGDFYKQIDSATDSVGTIAIYKFPLFGDPYEFQLVASYSARPDSFNKFYDNCLILLEAYNAAFFPENEDLSGFQTYLEKKHLEDKYLMRNIDFSGTLEMVMESKRKWGWTPANSKKKLFSIFVNYCHETVVIKNDLGESVEVKRVQTFSDVGILEEILSYKPDANVDRITAHMGAVGFLHYLEKNYIYPKNSKRKEQEIEVLQPKKSTSFYSNPVQRKGHYRRR
jgi:hypothetical protein